MTTPTHDPRDRAYMEQAIQCAEQSIPAPQAYCVGAVLVTTDGTVTTGFSRELPGNTHAEECALAKLQDARSAHGATMYTTMEPCSERLSGNRPCTSRLLEAQVARVVVGVREPPNLVAQCTGLDQLRQAGIEVVFVPGVEEACLKPNRHILDK